MLDTLVPAFLPKDPPEGAIKWKGRQSAPADYINGPVWLRDGTMVPIGHRHSDDQWTWYNYDTAFGQRPDDIVGYMSGYIKAWENGEEAPEDWEGGSVLWNDGTVWSDGLQRTSIGWTTQPGWTRAHIVAYTSTFPILQSSIANKHWMLSDGERLRRNHDAILHLLGNYITERHTEKAIELYVLVFGGSAEEAEAKIKSKRNLFARSDT